MPRKYNKCKAGVALVMSMMLTSNAFAFAPSPSYHHSIVSSQESTHSLCMYRRDAIDVIKTTIVGAGVVSMFGSAKEVSALDMDSFEKSLIDQDTSDCDPNLDRKCTPKLSADEALCKYGVPGSDSRSVACRRVRDAGGLLPGPKKGERDVKGWVDNPIAL